MRANERKAEMNERNTWENVIPIVYTDAILTSVALLVIVK
jgi:hypothetical protein